MTCRFYNWCLTDFFKNCEDVEEDVRIFDYSISTPDMATQKVQYIVWGLEKCPTTEKLHVHYYVEFTEKVSMKWIKESFNNNTLHCEPRKGTQKQAIDYVKKDETKVFLGEYQWFEIGEKKTQGSRTDLDGMVDMIEENHTGREILLMYRGNGLRHINMIYRCINSFRSNELIDLQILAERGVNDFDEKNK